MKRKYNQKEGIDLNNMSGIYYAKRDRMRNLKKAFNKVELIEKYVFKKKGFSDKALYIYRCN